MTLERLAKTAAAAILAVSVLAVSMLATPSPAGAEVVLHRGNGGEPQTLDQAHTSIDVEANVLKDLYEGLTVYDGSG
jgi:oligopeptide transport system substrate-binding protein